MLNINQFRELIVQSTLRDLLSYSPVAEEILIFTCAVESLGGTYIKQVGGSALGIYQMEPETHNDIWQNFIFHHAGDALRLSSQFDVSRIPDESRLIYDMRYSTAMARIFYARIAEPLPKSIDENLLWEYYKKYYNTEKGKAQKDESIKKYHDFVQYQR